MISGSQPCLNSSRIYIMLCPKSQRTSGHISLSENHLAALNSLYHTQYTFLPSMAAVTTSHSTQAPKPGLVARTTYERLHSNEDLPVRVGTPDAIEMPTLGDQSRSADSESAVSLAPQSHTRGQPSLSTKLLRKVHLLGTAWWLLEVAASILSLLCLVGIAVVAFVNQGRPLTMTRHPSFLTLNATLSTLSTLNRSLLMVPVGSAVMQDLWLWYGERNHSGKRNLGNLDIANAASRGPGGSTLLLPQHRGKRYVPLLCLPNPSLMIW